MDNYQEKYHWEWHEDRNGKFLNALFKNDVPPEKRKSILSRLDITPEQEEFLLKTYDIDLLVIKNKKPVLIEEKSVGIQRLKKVKGNSLLVTCNMPTQPQTLQKASDIGIEAGVLVKFMIWGTLGPTVEGTVRRHMGYEDGTKEVYSKFYRWRESASQSGKQIKLVDDFQLLANKLDNQSTSK